MGSLVRLVHMALDWVTDGGQQRLEEEFRICTMLSPARGTRNFQLGKRSVAWT